MTDTYTKSAKTASHTKEYECIVYNGGNSTTVIGNARLMHDGVISVFNHLQPISGVFYLRPKKAGRES